MASSLSMENDGNSSEITGGKGFMLFGVRVTAETGLFRKSASTNNLSQFEQTPDINNDVAAGYASDDVLHTSDRGRHRKRGVAWSEEEHKLFLLGLQKVGKGDWRGISRNFVKTRTPTQVASHAQKYFLRRNNHNRRRRRSSLFDITTETVLTNSTEDQTQQENTTKNPEILPIPSSPVIPPLKLPIKTDNPLLQLNQLNNSPRPLMPIPILPVFPSSKMANLDLNRPTAGDPPFLSLNSLSLSQTQLPSAGQSSKPTRFPASFKESGGDSIISVA